MEQLEEARIKNRLKYLLQAYPLGLKFEQIREDYSNFYGEELSLSANKVQCFSELCAKFTDVLTLKMNGVVTLQNTLINQPNHTLLLEDSCKYIPAVTLPENLKIDQWINVKIEHIYDPSKFWLVVKYQEVELFKRHMKAVYSVESERIEIPAERVVKGMYCVLEKDLEYYRVVVISLLLGVPGKIRVFLIDYGNIMNVQYSELFYIHKHLATIARFSIRATLSSVCPSDCRRAWSSQDLVVFYNLIKNRRLVACITGIDDARKILRVVLRENCGHDAKLVNVQFVEAGVARFSYIERTKEEQQPLVVLSKYISLVPSLYLLPSFEALESGKVPSSLWEFDLLKHNVQLDYLYPGCYQYKPAEN